MVQIVWSWFFWKTLSHLQSRWRSAGKRWRPCASWIGPFDSKKDNSLMQCNLQRMEPLIAQGKLMNPERLLLSVGSSSTQAWKIPWTECCIAKGRPRYLSSMQLEYRVNMRRMRLMNFSYSSSQNPSRKDFRTSSELPSSTHYAPAALMQKATKSQVLVLTAAVAAIFFSALCDFCPFPSTQWAQIGARI